MGSRIPSFPVNVASQYSPYMNRSISQLPLSVNRYISPLRTDTMQSNPISTQPIGGLTASQLPQQIQTMLQQRIPSFPMTTPASQLASFSPTGMGSSKSGGGATPNYQTAPVATWGTGATSPTYLSQPRPPIPTFNIPGGTTTPQYTTR